MFPRKIEKQNYWLSFLEQATQMYWRMWESQELDYKNEEGENVFDWLNPEEEWKLLDGMPWEKVEELAGMRLDGGNILGDTSKATLWDSRKKKDQVDAVQMKLTKQNARDASRKLKNLEDEYGVLEQKNKDLSEVRTSLDKDAETWKNGGLVELEKLAKEIENTPQPTTQEELDDYRNKVDRYNALREQGLALQNRTDGYNAKLTNYNQEIERLQKEVKLADTMKSDAIAKSGMKIVDKLL